MRSIIDKLKALNDSYPDDNEFTNDMRSKINALSDLNDKCSSNLESNFVKNMKSNIARLTQSYNRYIEISKKFQKYVSRNISIRSCTFCISPRNFMGGMLKKDKCKIRAINRCKYATNV